MDIKSSNALKALIKRSDWFCIWYIIGCFGFGIPLLIYGVHEALNGFHFGILVGGLIFLGFVIAGIILMKKLITKDYGTGIQDYFAEHPEMTIDELDHDFAEAERVVKSLWIANKCTYHIGYLYPYIIDNKDLIWVYLTEVSGKGGGSWKVNFCDKNKRMTSIALKSEKKAKRIADIYNSKFPHLVVGFNDDLERMYNEDLESFLNLRYNQQA